MSKAVNKISNDSVAEFSKFPNEVKNQTLYFLMEHGQKSNPDALKELVNQLCETATQKDTGQRKKNIDWNKLDPILWSIVWEAVTLVLSGDLDDFKSYKKRIRFADKMNSELFKANLELQKKLNSYEELNRVRRLQSI